MKEEVNHRTRERERDTKIVRVSTLLKKHFSRWRHAIAPVVLIGAFLPLYRLPFQTAPQVSHETLRYPGYSSHVRYPNEANLHPCEMRVRRVQFISELQYLFLQIWLRLCHFRFVKKIFKSSGSRSTNQCLGAFCISENLQSPAPKGLIKFTINLNLIEFRMSNGVY